MARVEPNSGGRVAVMAFSGGAGVVAADSLADAGIDLAWTMDDPESCGTLSERLEAMGIPAVDEISKGVRVLSAMTRRK